MSLNLLPVRLAVSAVALTLASTTLHLGAEPIADQYRQNGVAIGCQAYTFNRYSVFEAIEKTAEAGGKVIEFFPGQKLTKEEPKLVWNHQASEEIIQRVEKKLAEHGIKAVNYGVAEDLRVCQAAQTLWSHDRGCPQARHHRAPREGV